MSALNHDSLKVKGVLLGISPLVILPSSAISPALPAIEDYFAHVENSEYWVRLVLTMPALSIIIGGLIAGQIIDRVGRKKLLIGSAIVAAASGTVGYGLDSLLLLILTRIALGFAVAGAITSVTTLIADYYEQKMRSTLMGLQSTCIAFVGVGVLTLSGVLADISWRAPFLIYLFPLLLVPFMMLWLDEPIYDIVNQEDTSASLSWRDLPLLTLGIIYGVELLHMLLFYITPVQLPFYLRSSFDASASLSGVAIATMSLCQGGISTCYGWLKARFSFANVLAIAFTLGAIGHSTIALATSFPMIILGLAISGLGFGLLFPNCKVWVSQTVTPNFRGRALGGLTTAFYIGEFLSPFASQTTVQWVGASGTYALASAVLGLVAVLAVAVSSPLSITPLIERLSRNS